LTVDFISFAQARFQCPRICRFEPLHKIRTAQTVGTLSEKNDGAAVRAGVRRHVQRFVRLNHVDVVRRATTTDDHQFAFL
jgi:hypothetical protein